MALPDLRAENISGSMVDQALFELSNWLRESAEFAQVSENIQSCVDKNFSEAIQFLLEALDLPEQLKEREWRCGIWRTGPAQAIIGDALGPVICLVPIRLLTPGPSTIGPEMQVGQVWYARVPTVTVRPGLEVLVVSEA